MDISKTSNENLAQAFRIWYVKERGYTVDEFVEVYMENPEGCLPESCIGDDLAMSIINKVYWFHRFIAKILMDEFKPTFESTWTDQHTGKTVTHSDWIVTVTEPNYEGETFVVMLLRNNRILLYHDSFKMWNFYFPTLETLGKQLREVYDECVIGIREWKQQTNK